MQKTRVFEIEEKMTYAKRFAVVLSLFFVSQVAFAQLSETELTKRKGAGILGKFKGSFAKVTTYMGSGSFIDNGYSDNPYVSGELFLYPRFKLDKNMDLRGYWVAECEFTQPDNPTGRACSPSDLRLSFHHNRLWIDPWLKGMIMGNFQAWLPVSYESQFNHTVANLRAAATYLTRVFKDKVELAYGLAVQKYIPTRRIRDFINDEVQTGAKGLPMYSARASAGQDGSVGSGGFMNDNWLFINNFHVGYYFTPNLSLSIDLLVYNYIRYSVPEEFSDPTLSSTGRADWTWGIIEANYQPLEYLVLTLGVASLQPALSDDAKTMRFPFYDFATPYNNYTKWYLGATFLY
ncbi:MAG: hypothetical protein V1754_06080 [Pseudomonadota bacterium]